MGQDIAVPERSPVELIGLPVVPSADPVEVLRVNV